MDRRKQASSSKSKTISALIVSKAKLTPIPSNRPVISRTTNEPKRALKSTIDTTCRTDQQAPANRIKLTSNPSNKSTSKVLLNKIKRTSITAPATSIEPTSDTIINPTIATMIFSRLEETTSVLSYHSSVKSLFPPFQHIRLIWLNSNEIQSNKDYTNSINKLRTLIGTIDIFTNSKECIEFVKAKAGEILFIIISNKFAESTIPFIHDMTQIHSIVILCEHMPEYERWTKIWIKVKGVFNSIDSIYEILEREIRQCRRRWPSITVSTIDLLHIDPLFISTQLLKEIIVEMKFNDNARNEFIQYCRQKKFINNSIIDEFERDYRLYTPIWWYTKDSFLINMINQAFQLQDINLIIKMGFFIQDLHYQIQNMYNPLSKKLILYRGQGLSCVHFQQLRTMQGGLFSFNSFLSATIYEEVALSYANHYRHDPNLISIIFKMHIDPTALTTTQLVSLDNKSYFSNSEGEFLFTIHTIFRIGEIKYLDDNLWQIELSLINDNDKDIKQLTEYIRQLTQELTGWDRLGELLFKIDSFNKAEEVFEILIENSSQDDLEDRSGLRYHLMGIIKTYKGEYKKAILFYHKALKLYQVSKNLNNIDLATLYKDMGLLYQYMEEYSDALQFYQMARDICDQSNPLDYSNLVIIYGYIAELNKIMKQYSEALQYYQIILEIQMKSMYFNVSDIVSTYTNMADIYLCMKEYTNALKLFQYAFNRQQGYLPQNYIKIATIENNIGLVYEQMGEQSKAAEHYQNALKHYQTMLESNTQNVSDLVIIYNSIAQIHMKRKEYLEAFEFCKKTLRIINKYPYMKKPDLGTIYNDIGQMCDDVGNCRTSHLCYQQAMRIARQSLPQKPSQLRLYRTHFDEVQKKL